MNQLRSGVLAEGEGKQVQHLHALRQYAVKIDAIREFAEAEVLRDKAQMVADCVRLYLRSKGVHGVVNAIRSKNPTHNPSGDPVNVFLWRGPVACAFDGAQATGPRHHNQAKQP